MMMPEEEGVAADKGPAVEASATEARPDEGCVGSHWPAGETRPKARMGRHRCAGEASTAEASTAELSAAEMSAAHASHAHAAPTEMAAATEAAAETAMPAAAETTTVAAAPTSTSGENRRSERQCRSHGRRDEAGEKPVVHLNILLIAATVSPLQGIR